MLISVSPSSWSLLSAKSSLPRSSRTSCSIHWNSNCHVRVMMTLSVTWVTAVMLLTSMSFSPQRHHQQQQLMLMLQRLVTDRIYRVQPTKRTTCNFSKIIQHFAVKFFTIIRQGFLHYTYKFYKILLIYIKMAKTEIQISIFGCYIMLHLCSTNLLKIKYQPAYDIIMR